MSPAPGRASWAFCPEPACGKRLRVPDPVRRGDGARTPVFPGHRRPAGGTCPSSGARVLAAHREHPCVDCAKRPPEQRPAEPRPIDPRSRGGAPRCTSDLREQRERQRVARSVGRRLRVHGVSVELSAIAREAQGGGCACGRPFSPKYTPRTDHDHRKAREVCGHDPEHACPNCYRGDLHDLCNVTIGRLTSDQLRRLADYKDAGGTMAIVRARPGYTGP